ncbi:acyl-CoA dehydrogenase family protein [Polycladidibacter hongkongensis]|uniref:acyl-CoA dehydrogenase family protein n=1 Tax=Polycladidibacter hongkongensis TaxID=1647556 RepID=UPI000830DE0B|nr:acyl-CoA dehydrogenase family protein [Pseudovibrio hongkongensis]
MTPPSTTKQIFAIEYKAEREEVLSMLRALSATCRELLSSKLIEEDSRPQPELLEKHQHALHSLAWLESYITSITQLCAHADRLANAASDYLLEDRLIHIALAEYLAQVFSGIPMSQLEYARLTDLGLTPEQISEYETKPVDALIALGQTEAVRAEAATRLEKLGSPIILGEDALDETLIQFRDEMQRFCEAEVVPYAHEWHLQNAYIPEETINKMANLGVFGLTIPEEYGGLGLGKLAMCVVSEELSRGYLGVGSLGTRSEIAAELILAGGTPEQRATWLPKIASGKTLPCAVFTEPNTGSDLASLKTRAERDGSTYHISGAKTWITHPVRADVMTLLARTNPQEKGYRGLSMFLAEKPRGTDSNPFPAEGIDGSEIEVLGYRGMKEYEIGFDRFSVDAKNLLGAAEGQGFKQLMTTFESARIQTAARAVGVTQSALEQGMRYAQERKQFGKPLAAFPRVANKLVLIAAELLTTRLLTYHAAQQKDQDIRCDVEAGMAKLLAARAAWAAADCALQIHGGNGFALEYPISRILCDARVLSIFEGAAEIQAQIIGKRLLEST